MVEIKNREQLIDELTDKLKEFDAEQYPYQIDVYAYVNDDGTITLDEFSNVGGNSWRDDDHITVYRHTPCYPGYAWEYITNSGFKTALYLLGISEEEAIYKTGIDPEMYNRKAFENEVLEELSYLYKDKAKDIWRDYVYEELDDDYYEEACDIISRLEDEICE